MRLNILHTCTGNNENCTTENVLWVVNGAYQQVKTPDKIEMGEPSKGMNSKTVVLIGQIFVSLKPSMGYIKMR